MPAAKSNTRQNRATSKSAAQQKHKSAKPWRREAREQGVETWREIVTMLARQQGGKSRGRGKIEEGGGIKGKQSELRTVAEANGQYRQKGQRDKNTCRARKRGHQDAIL
jgi:hypothetical protein